MSTPRVTLSRSCTSCIKAKRRCDLTSPSCSRCRARNLRCLYLNELSTETPTPAMQTSLWLIGSIDFSSSKGYSERSTACNLDVQHACDRKLDAILRSGHSSNLWRESAFAFANGIALRSVCPTIRPVELTLDNSTMQYILCSLCGAQPQRMTWVHKKLILWLPYPAKAMKVIGLTETASRQLDQQTTLRVTEDLEVCTQELIAYTNRARPGAAMLLCCVQTLLESQIALAFGNASQHIDDSPVYARRARQVKTLSSWCWSLWELAPWVLPGNIDAEQSWLFAESVRRTLLVAHILCDVFSVAFTGAFRFSGFVSTLPYDSRTWLWDDPGKIEVRESAAELQSFRQLVIKFENSKVAYDAVDEFEQLLLVTCRGYRIVHDRLNLPDQPMLDCIDRSNAVRSNGLSELDFAPFQ